MTMSSSTRLDSAVFQLTPTRTRCDLVITVNGKKEKIASGLLNPFLSHLKTARDQMAKGGYSIILQPENGSDASWFTRGTVERLVRFVSTPEILERVHTIESEILQIEEAIAIQGNNSIGISTVEDNRVKHVENSEASKTPQDANEEKAIVLYKPDAQLPQSNGTTGSEGNSKVQLLKVLETRKTMLQKEQGMAFARAVAAGFDIDCLPALMSFAECFGASRLMDAGKKFIDLWKRKHESGQWVEIEAAETMRNHTDFSAVNASGIVFSNMAKASELDAENNVKAGMPPVDRQLSIGTPENIQGQFPHHMYPPWPIHSPPGTVPVFQPYPVQGIPYYQNYSGNSPYMQPIYPPMEDPRLNGSQSKGRRRHSMDSRYSHTESEIWDGDASKSDDVDIDNQGSQTGERWKKGSRSSRQKSGKVVIQNINFITKTENSSGSGSCSDSASEIDEDKDAKGSVKTSKGRGSSKESLKKLNSSDKEETDYGKDTDGGHWQAFQSFLLRDVDEDRNAFDQDQFELKRGDHIRRKKNVAGNDPLVFSERDVSEIQGDGTIDIHSISKGLTHMPKGSADELLLSGRSGQSGNGRSVDDVQYSEIEGRRRVIRRTTNDDFMILKQEGQSGNAHASSDLMAVNGLGYSNNNLERKLSHNVNDDSYIFEYRSTQVNDVANNERNAIDMDSEFPMVHQKAEKSSNQNNYELNELSLMPERNADRGSIGYDPALDFEMQAQAVRGASRDDKNKEVLPDTKPGPKKLNKEQRSKMTSLFTTSNTADQRKSIGPIRRGKTSKLSPLDEARARAESLRNYKADLQKIKKQKEAEEIKRLEALKIQRQKRIAARSGSTSTPSPSQPTKKQLPLKLSPSSHKGSKFSDSEPGFLSPLQRFPVKTASAGSNDSSKTSKPGRLITKSQSAENRLTRSASYLPEAKQEKADGATDTKASMARIRRLSEPKMSVTRHTSSVKPHSTVTILKTKPVDAPDSKKISAIVSHDKSKTATLPELKIRTPQASDTTQNRSSAKEKTQKLNGNKSSISSESEGSLLKKNENASEILPNGDRDDNPVVEKTVVMLEFEKPSMHAIHVQEEKPDQPKIQYNKSKVTEKTETVSEHVAVRAPASQQRMDIVDRETSESQSQLQPVYTAVKVNNLEKELSKSASIGIAEEAYRPPYARVSSLEDPCTGNSGFGKAPPTGLENADIGVETVRARVSDYRNSTLEKIPEATEKPQVKESKGFRRLLKFGRKNHSSATGGRKMESDNVSIDGSEADEVRTNNFSNEVHTLKSLISRDETPTASTPPQKSSRSFSLLSPFRSKCNEKKVAMA